MVLKFISELRFEGLTELLEEVAFVCESVGNCNHFLLKAFHFILEILTLLVENVILFYNGSLLLKIISGGLAVLYFHKQLHSLLRKRTQLTL